MAAGYIWSLAAPRALLVIVSPGAAGLVHTETAAFIAADLTFCLIGLAGGVLSGGLGYLLGVRRYGPLAMIGVLAGALAAALLARWVGEQSGPANFHHLLATLPGRRPPARFADAAGHRGGRLLAVRGRPDRGRHGGPRDPRPPSGPRGPAAAGRPRPGRR